MAPIPTPNISMAEAAEPDVFTSWTPDMVDLAMDEHERGQLQNSSLLADAIQRDGRVFTSLNSRVLGVLGLPFAFNESDEVETQANRKESRTLARRIRAWWPRCLPEATQADLLRAAIICGLSVGELTWKREVTKSGGEVLVPSLHVHSNQHVYRDPSTKQLMLMTIKGPIPITPGDGRWVVFSPAGAARPWMEGAIRALAIPFLIRQQTQRNWVDRSEIEATGIRKATVPESAKEEEAAAFITKIRKLGRKTVLGLRGGYDFSIGVTDKGAHETFEKLIARADSDITLTILGQNLTSQIESGSYAAASVHARVLQDRIESDVAMLATVLREQVLLPWARFNIPDFDRAILPWPAWDVTPPEDLQKRAAALISVSQALTSLEAIGVDITPELERFELQLLPEKDSNGTQPTPDQAPSPAAPGTPGGNQGARFARPWHFASARRRR